ncbi:MAG TPA: hypothetical protein VFD59_00630 [Nocardioidaceae bacterium]|nr:hypothetical protein [Nocardioidaceae bacterium]
MGSGRPVIYLHVGAMKTGTTFLQHLMHANRDNLLAAGFLVAGDRTEQGNATRDILGTAAKTPERLAQCEGTWNELVGRMFAHRGEASLFSMEFLSFADREQAARVVDSLEGADVHIILTVRDATGALPSQWQTHARNGGGVPWPKFAKGVRKGVRSEGPPHGAGARTFLRAQGIPRMIDAWGSAVPPERFHIILVPPSGSDPMLLWERFAGVIGVDPGVCSISTPRNNPSLGYPSAELMRLINRRLGKLPPAQFDPTIKAELATRILTERSPMEQSAQLNLSARRFAASWNRRVRRAIRASGAHVVGDLNDLPGQLPDDAELIFPKAFSRPRAEDILAAAGTARDGLIRLIRTRAGRLEAVGDRVDLGALDTGDLPTAATRWDAEADPVDAAVDELTALVRFAIEVQTRVEAAPALAHVRAGAPSSDTSTGASDAMDAETAEAVADSFGVRKA